MAPGGKVKFGPERQNIYADRSACSGRTAISSASSQGRRPRAAAEDLSAVAPHAGKLAQAVINGLLIGGIYALVSMA